MESPAFMVSEVEPKAGLFCLDNKSEKNQSFRIFIPSFLKFIGHPRQRRSRQKETGVVTYMLGLLPKYFSNRFR